MQDLIKKSLPAIELLVSYITLVMWNKLLIGGNIFQEAIKNSFWWTVAHPFAEEPQNTWDE